jgi:hypothetical protein
LENTAWGAPALADGAEASAWYPGPNASNGSPEEGSHEDLGRFDLLAAQEAQGQGDSDEAMRAGDIEARIAALEAQRDQVKTRGPRVATIAGFVVAGVVLVVGATAGIACAVGHAGTGTTCSPDNAIGFGAAGGTLALAGLATGLIGLSKLRERNGERSEFETEIRELRDLREKQESASSRLGVDRVLGSTSQLTVHWSF